MRGKNISAEDLTAKKELALEVIRRLKAEYPDAGCTLDYDHAWQLLVSVRLAAQCTDARVNIVVQDLFAKYPSVAALAEAEPEDIEAIVKPCGLGRSKARDISACMRMLRDKYDCKVPTTLRSCWHCPAWAARARTSSWATYSASPPSSPTPTASACATRSALWTASRNRRRWRWRSGRSSRPKRAVICATVS